MADPHADNNPKTEPDPGSNTEKDPDDWTTGGEPMTGAQASYLKTLSEQAHDAEAFEDGLTKAEASKRIDAYAGRWGWRDDRAGPPPLNRALIPGGVDACQGLHSSC